MKCPQCQQENPLRVKFCLECGVGLSASSELRKEKGVRGSRRKAFGSRVPDIEKRLAEALKREAEALDRQTATAEILRVISSSPTDIQPVLSAVAESAARLCHAYDVTVFRVEGDVLRLVAHHGPVPATPELMLPVNRGTIGGRTILEARTIQVADAQVDDGEYPLAVTYARQFGHRTLLSVPLTREGVALGVIQLRRTEAEPFTDTQIALLQTFADQAVIAIENVRLFTELQARNRDLTATSEILQVISRSPPDAQPIFTAIARSARRLCDADSCSVFTYGGDLIHLRVVVPDGWPHADDLRRSFPTAPTHNFAAGACHP